MRYVILDLEWNGSYSKRVHKFVNEIIEFGAVKVDSDLEIIDTFSALITPQIAKKLSSKVRELTKITNEELNDKGITFMEAVEQFTEFSKDSVLLTWGTSDIHALIENYSYYTDDIHLPFLNKYCDLQVYCESCLDLHNAACQLGLSTCADKIGITFSEEEQHRAFFDSLLSLKCMSHFIKDYPLDNFINDAQQQAFYDRMLFKTHFITDLNSDEIDKTQLIFNCDICGADAKQLKQWRLHNKSFVSEFSCTKCSRSFLGRISFKKKYDSVTVNKKIVEKKQKENKDSDSDKKLKIET